MHAPCALLIALLLVVEHIAVMLAPTMLFRQYWRAALLVAPQADMVPG
jgi:hypothetical protein